MLAAKTILVLATQEIVFQNLYLMNRDLIFFVYWFHHKHNMLIVLYIPSICLDNSLSTIKIIIKFYRFL